MKKMESYKVFKQAYLEANLINKLVHKFKNSGYVFATPGDISSLNICINSKMQIYKISSGLASNHYLVRQIAKKKTNQLFFQLAFVIFLKLKNLLK